MQQPAVAVATTCHNLLCIVSWYPVESREIEKRKDEMPILQVKAESIHSFTKAIITDAVFYCIYMHRASYLLHIAFKRTHMGVV